MNITDFERTPVHVVLREIEKLAAAESVLIAGYELIGLMPRKAVEMALAEGVKLPGFDDGSILENRLDKFLPR
jgi:glutamate formiminotransferase